MRITMLGVLAVVGFAVLLFHVGTELRRMTQANAIQRLGNPNASINP
jgi:hypothetical protein